VFDCAASFEGTTLNKQVMQGPDLMNDLLGILLRFRERRVAVAADIKAMFHQVKVTPRDRDVLRFLWWPKGDFSARPKVYRMTVHLFGGVWSPACASFALLRTLSKIKLADVKRNFYVDDLLMSVENEATAIHQAKQLKDHLKHSGFHLTKWMSNSKRVITAIPQEDRSPPVKDIDLTKQDLPTDRALGVLWSLKNDVLQIRVTVQDKPISKRGMLSIMGSVYDPLGLLAPFTVRAKMIYQEEVRRQRGWDEELSSQNSVKWNAWLSELRELEGFCVNRCIVPMNLGKIGSVQLHHFCDASTKAFAAASYLRIQDVSGITHCALMLARTRLAPIKTTTIPRLELSAAVLAATSDAKLRKELSLPIDDSVFWTDSTIVLQYIKNTSRRFHTFVANRVGIIHKNSSPQQWRHVRSELNTADPASRGLSAIELMQRKDWKEGAEFLLLPETSWPLPPELPGISNDDPEVKNMTISFAAGAIKVAPVDPLFERYSSWYKLQRIVAWLRRFCSACRKKCSHQDSNLSVMEIQAARMVIIRQVQMTCFAEELDILKRRKNLKASRLYRLEPHLDDQGMLRVGGRRVDEYIDQNSKRPLILPKDHPVTALIVQDIHVFHARHSGREHTLAELRRKYWIVAGRPLVDRILRNCFTCRRVNSKPLTQRQGDLPIERVTPWHPPFLPHWSGLFWPISCSM